MESADSVSQVPSQDANSTASSKAIPPVPNRRPRVREVSSRFMSALTSPSPSSCPSPSPSPSSSISYTPGAGDSQHRAKSPVLKYGVSTPLPSSFHSKQHQRSKSAQRSRGGEPDPLRYSDENVKESAVQLRLNPSKQQLTFQQQQRKPRLVASPSNKLPKDKENVGKPSDHESPRRSLESQTESTGSMFRNGTFVSSKRPDTPVPVVSAKERIVSSRYRLCSRSLDRALSGPAAAAATGVSVNLLRSHSNNEFSSGYNSASETDEDDNNSTTWSSSEPNTPRVSQTDHDSSKSLAPTWSSKLNKPVHQSRSLEVDGLSKAGNFSLPPLPCQKQQQVGAADSRKGRKNSNQHQEDMHSLKLLHNHHMQWRFINAKSKASMIAEKNETEKKLYSLGCMTTELRESVHRKCIELKLLKMKNTINTILKAQMPYLDEWSELEGDYSLSLSDATKALVNASLQLPLGGNVHVDIKEVREALGSAIKMMESISCNINGFIPRSEEAEVFAREVARVVGGERALVEECGELLHRRQALQVEECSLRGQIMQLAKGGYNS